MEIEEIIYLDKEYAIADTVYDRYLVISKPENAEYIYVLDKESSLQGRVLKAKLKK